MSFSGQNWTVCTTFCGYSGYAQCTPLRSEQHIRQPPLKESYVVHENRTQTIHLRCAIWKNSKPVSNMVRHRLRFITISVEHGWSLWQVHLGSVTTAGSRACTSYFPQYCAHLVTIVAFLDQFAHRVSRLYQSIVFSLFFPDRDTPQRTCTAACRSFPWAPSHHIPVGRHVTINGSRFDTIVHCRMEFVLRLCALP